MGTNLFAHALHYSPVTRYSSTPTQFIQSSHVKVREEFDHCTPSLFPSILITLEYKKLMKMRIGSSFYGSHGYPILYLTKAQNDLYPFTVHFKLYANNNSV